MVEENPAVLSSALRSLFPPAVAAAELTQRVDAVLLLPEEARYLGRSVPGRVAEFTAGRLCARRALQALGIVNFPIEMAADRRPLWPSGIVGSITHTAGYCLAAAARVDRVSALGVDSERVGRVQPKLWPRLFTGAELVRLESLPEERRTIVATLMFCAKEAFYKCQYTLVAESLGFQDAEIDIDDVHQANGEWQVRTMRPAGFSPYLARAKGRFRLHQGFATTALAVEAQ